MKKNNLIILFAVVAIVIGCEQPMTYKFQDKPQKVDCPGMDKSLMHEALYSFQEDIGVHYNQYTDNRKGTSLYYMEGYAQYVFFGFSGSAPYGEIVSNHSLDILDKLRNETDLWTSKQGMLSLNYNSDYVSCLINSIEDKALREKLINLRDVNYLTPQVIAETMRVNVIRVVEDPYLAMYMALDAYYQPLMNRNFSKSE
jgi:hypothetical protein